MRDLIWERMIRRWIVQKQSMEQACLRIRSSKILDLAFAPSRYPLTEADSFATMTLPLLESRRDHNFRSFTGIN
jgi:hypothetical protein